MTVKKVEEMNMLDFVKMYATPAIWIFSHQQEVLSQISMRKVSVNMILPCPHCGLQHIDAPEPDICECSHEKSIHVVTLTDNPDFHDTSDACGQCWVERGSESEKVCRGFKVAWMNPPHRTHLCKPQDGGCGAKFTPAKIYTNGVKEL